jgi:SHS2 domain-containing protein
MAADFELLPHTADIKLRIYGKTLEELFANAVIGMFQSIGPQAPGCHKVANRLVCDQLTVHREVQVVGYDLPTLLVDFLSEALCLSDTYNEAYLAAAIDSVSVTPAAVQGRLLGIPITGFEHTEIKGVTYHALRLEEVDGGWQAEVVFDI